MIAMLLLACSDYEVTGKNAEPATAQPDTGEVVVAEPEPDIGASASEPVCSPDGSSITVTVTNDGEADLHVTSLSPSGNGWTLVRYDALPWTIAPGQAATVDLAGGTASGTLTVGSSDPDETALEVPLSTSGGPPTVVFTSPADDSVLGPDPTTITALVADDVTAPADLVLTWSSDLDGDACAERADADGVVTCAWDPATRATGPYHLSLTAVDECGASTTALLAVCQDGEAPTPPLVNEGFEEPVVSGMEMFEEGEIEGWIPTPGNVVEVWADGFSGVPAWNGVQFAEINGDVAGGIYQDITTIPGASYSITLGHRGRAGTDVARLLVDGEEVDSYTDGTGAWGTYTSTFVATGTTTRVTFEAVSAAGGGSVGNFLDIDPVVGPCEGFDG